MITFTIQGGSRKEQNLAYDAFDFAMKELMPRKRKIHVEISFTDLEGDVDGYHCCIEKGNHELEIQTDLIEEDLVTCIFHEMVHVRQHERGLLKDKGIVKSWKGEEFIGIYDTVDTYKNLPWEEEAYRLQEDMYNKWIQT